MAAGAAARGGVSFAAEGRLLARFQLPRTILREWSSPDPQPEMRAVRGGGPAGAACSAREPSRVCALRRLAAPHVAVLQQCHEKAQAALQQEARHAVQPAAPAAAAATQVHASERLSVSA